MRSVTLHEHLGVCHLITAHAMWAVADLKRLIMWFRTTMVFTRKGSKGIKVKV